MVSAPSLFTIFASALSLSLAVPSAQAGAPPPPPSPICGDLDVGAYFRPTGDAVTGEFNSTRAVARRSPCPAINALANHGFLPRDGLNISKAVFVSAIMTHFNLDRALVTFVASLVPVDVFSLDMLSHHNHGEHDMSMVHPDLLFQKDPAWVDPDMVADVFARVGASNTMDTLFFAKLKKQRMDACYATNPTCSTGPSLLLNVSLSQPGLLMRGMGGQNQELISVANAWSFLVLEKFPAGFTKAPTVISDRDLEISRDQIRRLYASTGDWLARGFAGVSSSIVSNADPSRCLAVKDRSLAAGAKLQLRKCDADKPMGQQFLLDNDQRIMVEHSKLCVDIMGSGSSAVVQATCSGSASQRWIYDASGRLKSLGKPTHCLTIRRGKSAKVALTPCGGGDQAFFSEYAPFNVSTSRLMSMTTQSLCLGVANASKAERATVEAAACNAAASEQTFTLEATGQIVAQHSSHCLAVGMAAKTLIQQTCRSIDALQRWFYDSLGRLRSRGADGQCITLSSSVAASAAIQLAECSDSPTQNWFAVDMTSGSGPPM